MTADRRAESAPVRVRARMREMEALALRAEGLSYAKIASRMGVSSATAYKWVKKALGRLQEKLAERAELVWRLELERLDELQAALWGKAQDGDVKAVMAILRIMERRAKLYGLDAPDRLEVQRKGLDLSQGVTPENVHVVAARLMTVLRSAEEATGPLGRDVGRGSGLDIRSERG